MCCCLGLGVLFTIWMSNFTKSRCSPRSFWTVEMHFAASERDPDCLKNHLAFRRHSIASENSHPVSPAADPGQVGRHELALGKNPCLCGGEEVKGRSGCTFYAFSIRATNPPCSFRHDSFEKVAAEEEGEAERLGKGPPLLRVLPMPLIH